jgi:hypothetical protein
MQRLLWAAFILIVFFLLLASTSSSLQAQSATVTATTASTAVATDTPFLLENVPISTGGIEVFGQPSRKLERLFAAVGTFAPYLAGQSEDGEWLYFYYFDGKMLKAAWAPVKDFNLSKIDKAGLKKLPIIDPASPPELPQLDYDALAARPYGARLGAATGTPVVQSTSAPPPGGDNGGNGGGAGNPQPTPGAWATDENEGTEGE